MSRELLSDGAPDDGIRDDAPLGPRAWWREAPTDLDGARGGHENAWASDDEADRDEADRDEADRDEAERRTSGPGTRHPATLRPRRLAVAGLAAGLVGAVLGWSGSGLAIPPPVPESTASQSVWAVAHHADPAFRQVVGDELQRPDGSAFGPSLALTLALRLTLVNFSDAVQTVAATSPAALATGDVRLDRLPITVAPRGTAAATARFPVSCTSPLPLDLPELLVTDVDGTSQRVPVTGAAAVLASVCSSFYPVAALTGTAVTDGDRLRVSLTPTGGRSMRAVGIEVGGVAMDAEPTPRPLDGYPTAIWLTAPTGCEQTWVLGGIPQQVVMVVEGLHGQVTERTRARIPIVLGAPLGDWLLDRSCAAD